MLVKCLAVYIHLYPSIFNRFPVIQARSLKIRHFSTFLHILASPVYAPGIIAVNVTRLEGGFNACKTPHLSIIYLQPFPSNSSRKFKKSPF